MKRHPCLQLVTALTLGMLSPSVFAGTLAVSESEGSEAAVSETVAPEPKKKSSFRLQRINVLTGAFVELDLVVAELKVLPYVELRFNRKK